MQRAYHFMQRRYMKAAVLGAAGLRFMDSGARVPVLCAANGDRVGIPADDRLLHDEFHKAYLAKVAAMRDVVFAFVKRILPNADEWGDRIEFDRLEFMPTETLDTAPRFGEEGDLMCNFPRRFQ